MLKTGERRYLADLDGLRAVAITAVLLFHSPLNQKGFFSIGWAGVDLFFVISGYLITGILMDSRGQNRYYRDFYMRRILRIWPLYFFMVFFVFVVIPLVEPSLRERIFEHSYPWQSYLFFVQNLLVKELGIGPIGITWSLAIEEQFYLVWPVVIAFCSRKTIIALLTFLILASPVARWYAFANGATFADMYLRTPFRLDAICAGSLLAILVRQASNQNPRAVRASGWLAVVGAIGVYLTLFQYAGQEWALALRFTALAALFAGIVGLAVAGVSFRALRMAPVTYWGKISFGLYMFHVTVFDFLTPQRLGLSGSKSQIALAVVIDFLVIGCAAAFSWKFVELPILSLKKHFNYSAVSSRSAEDSPVAHAAP